MRSPVLILALLLAAAPATADEIRSRVSFQTSFDSDQREASDRFEERSGYSASVVPSFELISDRERLRYNLHYRPALFYFSEADPHDRLNHRAEGGLSYDLGPRTTLGSSFSYRNTETLLRDRDFAEPGEPPELVFERERRQSGSLSLDLSHRWSRRLSTSLGASQSFFVTDTAGRSDAFNTGLSASLNYRLGEDITTGLSASVRRQKFEDTPFREGTTTRFASLQATWTQKLDERTSLSLSAGPLLVDPEALDPPEFVTRRVPQFPSDVNADGDVFVFDAASCEPAEGGGFLLVPADCDVIDQALSEQESAAVRSPLNTRFATLPQTELSEGESEQQLTLSASASLTRRWRHTTASIRFSRSEGSVDGLGTSTVRNVLDANLEWKPSPEWRLRLWGNWTQRESTSDIERFVPVVEPTTLLIGGVPVVEGAAATTDRLQLVLDSSSADATFYRVHFGVWRRLARRWHVGSIFEYRNQTTESDFFAARRDFENVGVTLALTYRFPDFRPW